MKIDLTPIFQAIIALVAMLITCKLIPWLQTKLTQQQMDNIERMAKAAVAAAEQIFPKGANRQKLDYALSTLEKSGFHVDSEMLRTAVENAVYGLTNNMYLPAYTAETSKETGAFDSDNEEGDKDIDGDENTPKNG